MAMTIEVDDLGTLLKLWRTAANLSLDDVAERASAALPPSRHISRELVRRYEANLFPAHGPHADVVAAIAKACERRLSELPEEVATDIDVMTEVLRKSCFPLSALTAA